MKKYLSLYKSKYNDYCPIKDNMTSELWDLNEFFFRDFHYYDQSLFTKDQSHYNETIIVNDLENRNFYIVVKDFDIENHIPDDDRHESTNEFNSCKISHDNFIEFREKWLVVKEVLPPFVIIYRDENDWIDCKGFNSKEEMEMFVANYQAEVEH